MNQFCKTFFGVFFVFVAALMLLLSYGLGVQLHRLSLESNENIYGMVQISTESVCQSEEDLLYWF